MTSPLRWLGLEIKSPPANREDTAIVEFVVRYKIGGRAYRLHVAAVHEDGHWYYLDGEFPEEKRHMREELPVPLPVMTT